MARLDSIADKLVALGGDHGVSTDGLARPSLRFCVSFPASEGAELFFIRRAEHPQDRWSRIAFPGGRRDPDDASLLATAIRETREEVGIDSPPPASSSNHARCPAFTKGNLVVTPFVFAIERCPRHAQCRGRLDALGLLATLARDDGTTTFIFEYKGQS